MKEVDHYELELHQFQMDRQKELLCTGKTFRVSIKPIHAFFASEIVKSVILFLECIRDKRS